MLDFLLGMLVLVFFWGLLATAGYFFGKSRGLGWAGALIGLLGPLGLIVIALMPVGVPCPHCQKIMHPQSRICPHCHTARDQEAAVKGQETAAAEEAERR